MSQQEGGSLADMAGWNPKNQQFADGTSYATNATDAAKMEYLAKMGTDWTYNQLLPWINLAIIIMGWFAISVEVFLRHTFGERYLNILRVFLAAFAMGLVVFGAQVGGALGSLYGERPNALQAAGGFLGGVVLQFVYWGFLGFSAYHLWQTYQRNKRGERWYSHSFGISRLSFLIGRRVTAGPVDFTINDWTLYRFVEPGLIWACSFIGGFLSGTLGFFLFLAAVTMFIKNNYLYSQARGRILDMMDAEIERDYLTQAMQGTDKRQTAGFTLVRPPRAMDRNNDGIPDPLQRPAAPAPTVPSARPDFSDVLADTIGQQPSAARIEGDAPTVTLSNPLEGVPPAASPNGAEQP